MALCGRLMHAHFSSAKGALRNLTQALACEYGRRGVRLAHLVINGAMNGDHLQSRFGSYMETLEDDGALASAPIAETFAMLHAQHRSAWTHEIDLRPFKEGW